MCLKESGSDCSRMMWTPTSTTAVIAVVRGGIVGVVVFSAVTFGGSSSWRMVLYYGVIGHMSELSELCLTGYWIEWNRAE